MIWSASRIGIPATPATDRRVALAENSGQRVDSLRRSVTRTTSPVAYASWHGQGFRWLTFVSSTGLGESE
jgi:hypothetical protein